MQALKNGRVVWRRLQVCTLSFQRLHELVLPLVMGVQQGEALGSSPYTSSHCRRELYHLLLALLLAPSPRCPPPLACALRAFSLGQREDSLEVTTVWAASTAVSPAQYRDSPRPDPFSPLLLPGLLFLLRSPGDLCGSDPPPRSSPAVCGPHLPCPGPSPTSGGSSSLQGSSLPRPKPPALSRPHAFCRPYAPGGPPAPHTPWTSSHSQPLGPVCARPGVCTPPAPSWP